MLMRVRKCRRAAPGKNSTTRLAQTTKTGLRRDNDFPFGCPRFAQRRRPHRAARTKVPSAVDANAIEHSLKHKHPAPSLHSRDPPSAGSRSSGSSASRSSEFQWPCGTVQRQPSVVIEAGSGHRAIRLPPEKRCACAVWKEVVQSAQEPRGTDFCMNRMPVGSRETGFLVCAASAPDNLGNVWFQPMRKAVTSGDELSQRRKNVAEARCVASAHLPIKGRDRSSAKCLRSRRNLSGASSRVLSHVNCQRANLSVKTASSLGSSRAERCR